MNNKKYGVLFALLPLLIEPLTLEVGAIYGCSLIALWWLTVLFFRVAEVLFPAKLFKFSIIMWIAFWVQLGWIYFGLMPYWVLSLYILTMSETGDVFSPDWNRIFSKGIAFSAALIVLGGLRDFFHLHLEMPIFNYPAALFLAGAALAFIFSHYDLEASHDA